MSGTLARGDRDRGSYSHATDYPDEIGIDSGATGPDDPYDRGVTPHEVALRRE